VPCYKPLSAWRSADLNPTGKRSMVFNPKLALEPDDIKKLPCGGCIGCRLRYSGQWAARCVHESNLYEQNCFVTLTFAPWAMNLRGHESISVRDCQLFMKRLRRHLEPKKVRFAYAGEYGDQMHRPHYHFLIFNHDFSADRYHWRTLRGYPYYRSPLLEEAWPFGHAEITDLNFKTAAYVSRYITKKVKGKSAVDWYNEINYSTGEIISSVTPEFFHMSRKPGLGKGWFDLYHKDWYPADEIIIDGKRMLPPKYYDSQFEILEPYEMEMVKQQRILNALQPHVIQNSTYERLAIREEIHTIKAQQLKRSYENGQSL